MIKTSVIMPVWNRADLTQRFLQQNWQRYKARNDIEWIVINNASTDTTNNALAYWKATMGDRLNVITTSENIGFGPANNKGAEQANGDTLIFISNDVQVSGDYITPLEQDIAANPGVLYGAQKFTHATGWNKFVEVGTIPYLGGWCLACTADLWKTVGGFDERYVPCDYEDLDLCYTVAQSGYELIEVGLPLHHESGQSAQALSGGRLAITMESQRKFLEKWGLTLAQ